MGAVLCCYLQDTAELPPTSPNSCHSDCPRSCKVNNLEADKRSLCLSDKVPPQGYLW